VTSGAPVEAGLVSSTSSVVQEWDAPGESLAPAPALSVKEDLPEPAPLEQILCPRDLLVAMVLSGGTTSTSSSVTSSSSDSPPAALPLPVDEQPPLCAQHDLLFSVLSSQMFPSGLFRPPRFVESCFPSV